MKRFIILFILFFLSLSKVVFSSEPPKEPILRIETGMHIANNIEARIDSDERYLVTGSYDKTIKVWELRTGRLIKTLRPPIGKENEGKIYRVAISPDGEHIAAGGWTGSWDGSYSLYIFELSSGKIIKRISNLPHRIYALSYSKDGKFLVAGLGNGIRVYRKEDYSFLKEDKDYEDRVNMIDFFSDGRLVTVSRDGYIRLYDRNFNLIKKKGAPGGKKPFGISFSPDGSKIAVGYVDTPNVDILSTEDLDKLYSAETGDLSKCSLSEVNFSSDGSYLYAAGDCARKFDDEWKYIIRRWEGAGKGIYLDILAANSTISNIFPLKSGSIVYVSMEPSFGIFDASGRLALYRGNDIADFRGQWDEFQVSYDGSVVRFGYEIFGKSSVVFDAENREFIDNREVKLLEPIIEMKGLEITDWKLSKNPKLNGKSIVLEPGSRSISLAISPDGKSFLLGTDWNLILFDNNGKEIWNLEAPASVWAVNISGNGKIAVAGFGDGTIRWYRIEDGEELLAFFPHKDKKRWVLWTPSGYYDASPGGEDFIGWHINNGKDREADFFPASRFRERFYRPDVIAKLFTTYDEERAVVLANEESGRKRENTDFQHILPPVITILSPQDGSTISKNELTVKYSLRNPTKEPVTKIHVLIDGRPLSQARGIQIKPKDEETGEITISVPERDFELSLIAENKYSASVPSTIRLHWKSEKIKSEEFVIKPKLYILAIGVSKYKNRELQLMFASKDAKDFVEIMKKQKGKIYQDVVAKLIVDEQATKDEILDGLEWLQKQVTSKDVGMIFIAGHGINDQTGIYYFLPVNADLEKLKRTAVPYSDIKNTVAGLAGKVLMFVDTCHSGNVFGKRAVTDITKVINELTSAESGVVVFSSSTGRQYSLEDPKWANGAFTKALVEGLSGKADLLKKGKITINMLDAYISERVKELTKGKQTPVTVKPETIPDFPIAIRP